MCFFHKPVPPVLTHPEESENYEQTINNANVPLTLTKWLVDWKVPVEYWDFWRGQIVIEVTTGIDAPACTWDSDDGKRHMKVKPEWLNPGVIAHEQAHNSYSLLTDAQKARFSKVYTPLKSKGLIAFLYSKNGYGLTSDVEGHAEIYRYLGEQMPATLKPFYPRLI
jgi:hypothetical protein